MPKLILFDVDQTLVDALSHHNVAYKKAFKEVFNVDANLTDIKFAGKIVPDIILELGELNGIPREIVKSKLPETIKRIESFFRVSVDKGEISILPGVKKLLEKLKKRNQPLGVVTGNPEGITRSILEKGGLKDYFDVLVYGSEGKTRVELVGMAIAGAERKFGTKFSGKDVVVVGDSIHDIDCGKPHGSLTIAVTTGFYSKDELIKHSPDYLFKDLTDPKILEVLQ